MDRIPPTLDMTPDGGFGARRRRAATLSLKMLVGACWWPWSPARIAVAAFALWLFSLVLPVLVLAGVAAWGTGEVPAVAVRPRRHAEPAPPASPAASAIRV